MLVSPAKYMFWKWNVNKVHSPFCAYLFIVLLFFIFYFFCFCLEVLVSEFGVAK